MSGAAWGWVAPPARNEVEELLSALAVRTTHRPHADLPYLAVATDRQGHGIGGLLLDQLIQEARTSGIEQLTLDARGDNPADHSLWRSRGFVEYGRLVDFVPVGAARYDKTIWVLDHRGD